jgi:hypothetical protein
LNGADWADIAVFRRNTSLYQIRDPCNDREWKFLSTDQRAKSHTGLSRV